MAQPSQLEQSISRQNAQATARPRLAPQPRFAPRAASPALSEVAQAIETRGRRFRVFPVSFLGGLKHIGVLYATGKDIEDALLCAHKSLSDLAGDPDALVAAKQRELLFRLLRDVDRGDPTRLRMTADGLHTYDAFPSVRWMAQHIGPDEESVLMRLVAEVRAEFAPRGSGALDTGVDDVDAIASELDAAVEAPGALLAHMDRAEVTALAVGLARRLVEVTRARDALMESVPE